MRADNIPLVSVIVPVYNVERYLEKCINSICSQSYPHIELILVDDGSTDHSGEICDRYAEANSNIKVIHQKNAGQSKARNSGIDLAKGELLLFVDSDDYICDQMLERMYARMVQDQSDLALCGYTFYDEDGKKQGTYTFPDEVKTGFQALMAYDKNGFLMTSIIWNKLYRKFLFDQIRFPVGRVHEDEATVYLLLDQCQKVSILAEPLYSYVQHSNTTMTSAYSVKRLDGVEACYERYFYYRRKGGDYLHFLNAEGDVFTHVFFRSKQQFKPVTPAEKKRVYEINRMAREICFDNFREWSLPRKIKLLAPDLYIWLSKMKRITNYGMKCIQRKT